MTYRQPEPFKTLCAAFFILAILAAAAPSRAALPEALPVLENAGLRVAFDPDSGRLAEFTDRMNGHAFVEAAAMGDLWTLHMLPPCPVTQIAPGSAQSFTYAFLDDHHGALKLAWRDFGVAEAPDLQVVATVSLDPDVSTAHWRIAVENTANLPLASLRFPRIPGIAPQENERLAAPIWMGQLAEEPRRFLSRPEKPGRMEWEYPGVLSLQCIALYREDGPGLFISSDDPAAFAKRFCVFGGAENRAGLEVVHLPQGGSAGQNRYEPAYRVALGTFEGDWFTAAERYRVWALQQPWAREARLKTGRVEDWAVETALWVWNRGRSGQVLTPARALQERTGLPVSVFWHWWHGCPYDIGFPEYLPPREGAEPFRDAVHAAREAGIHAMVYMNQRLWGMTTESWAAEGAERFAVKGPDGKVHPETYNTFKPAPCAAMCMGTSFWRNTYAGLAEQAVTGLGVGAIYMDQACASLPCYDPAHGHPIGGGTYWIDGFRNLQEDIRNRCDAQPDAAGQANVVLAGEGCGEAWLPYLDLMLSLQVSMERYAQPGVWDHIPFFHAVYHGYAIFFGNYSSLTMPPYDELWPAEFAPENPLELLDTKFSQQFRLEHARAFVWGQQPTIANFLPAHFEERPAELAYLTRLAKVRQQGLGYLLHGTMLRPPDLGLPEEEIDISRLSIYAGQQDALKQYRKACPRVMASAWQAADGSVAIVLANVTDEPQTLSLALPRETYPLPAPCTLARIDEEGVRAMGPFDGDAPLEASLPPAGACLYTFTAN